MQALFPAEQFFLFFNPFGIGDAAIDRTDSSALGFFVETDTFRAFVGNDIIIVLGYGFLL